MCLFVQDGFIIQLKMKKFGHSIIYGQFTNITDRDVIIEYGDTIMQGVFVNFKLTDNDTATNTRIGGFGSTGN